MVYIVFVGGLEYILAVLTEYGLKITSRDSIFGPQKRYTMGYKDIFKLVLRKKKLLLDKLKVYRISCCFDVL